MLPWAQAGAAPQAADLSVCVSLQRPSPDVKAELFELLFRTLHHNWRYFFKSTVLASVQRGISEEQMENEPQFSAIMQVMSGQGDRRVTSSNLALQRVLSLKPHQSRV